VDTTPETRREQRRVLSLFALTILPPLLLLAALAVVAARNDVAALRLVERERARRAAEYTSDALREAVRATEEELLGEVEPGRWAAGASAQEVFAAARAAHPLAVRFVAAELSGRLLWPRQTAPFGGGLDAAGLDEERPGASAEDYHLRGRLLARYAEAVSAEAAGRLDVACQGFTEVVASPATTPALGARAAFRLGACLERRRDPVAAREAYARAAAAPTPVRDERGRPVRVEAALRAAELLRDDARSAGEAAWELGSALLSGERHPGLSRSEWDDAIGRVAALLDAVGDPERAARLRRDRTEQLDQLDWVDLAARVLPELLEEARAGRLGEVLHFTRPGAPPLVIACRVFPGVALGTGGRGPVLVGVQLDLAVLAEQVLAPTCAALALETDTEVAVHDARQAVRARAGRALSGAERGGGAASIPLDPIPLWRVAARVSGQGVAEARRNRLILYGALLLLALVASGAGAAATIRTVARSLELAKLKADFLSNITHELKTPLTSVLMYGELLALGRARTPERQREYADHIVREAGRLQRLIDDVLDFARQDANRHDYVLVEEDVADAVAEAVDLFRSSAKVRGFDLYVELPPVRALPPVDLDRDALVRAVMNLLSNAAKYSGDQRWIRVAVTREGRDAIAIAVEDRGIGIDPGDLERIFDRFYRAGDVLTREVSGTGLGLSVVDHVVRAHGGEIRVDTTKGAGSTFTIELPIVEDYRDVWPPPSAEGEALTPA